jgi:membrane-associated phospholipid phosphatase
MTASHCSLRLDPLRAATAAAWITIGAIGAAVLAFGLLGPFEIEWRSFLLPVSATVLLATCGWYYHAIRNEERLGAILTATAQIVGFAAVTAPLSYVAAAAGFPVQDALLETLDRRLGVDWQEMVMFLSRHDGLQRLLLFAYSSFALQTVTTVLILGVAGQLVRLSTFIGAFIATSLVTVAVSAVCPATGPWLFLEVQSASTNGFLPVSATSWPVFIGLREGTLHTVYGLNSEGIITFPSLHAALAVLFAAALWRVRGLRLVALGLNGLMLVATPAYGSHYVVDVIAGIVVAAACWTIVARLMQRSDLAQGNAIAAIVEVPSIVPDDVPQAAQAVRSRKFESA